MRVQRSSVVDAGSGVCVLARWHPKKREFFLPFSEGMGILAGSLVAGGLHSARRGVWNFELSGFTKCVCVFVLNSMWKSPNSINFMYDIVNMVFWLLYRTISGGVNASASEVFKPSSARINSRQSSSRSTSPTLVPLFRMLASWMSLALAEIITRRGMSMILGTCFLRMSEIVTPERERNWRFLLLSFLFKTTGYAPAWRAHSPSCCFPAPIPAEYESLIGSQCSDSDHRPIYRSTAALMTLIVRYYLSGVPQLVEEHMNAQYHAFHLLRKHGCPFSR